MEPGFDPISLFGFREGGRLKLRGARMFKARVAAIIDADELRVRVFDPDTQVDLVVSMATADSIAAGDDVVVVVLPGNDRVALRIDLDTMPTGWSDSRGKCQPMTIVA